MTQDSTTVSDQQGGLDDLISAIRSGKAFGDASNTLRKKHAVSLSEMKNASTHLAKMDLKNKLSSVEIPNDLS